MRDVARRRRQDDTSPARPASRHGSRPNKPGDSLSAQTNIVSEPKQSVPSGLDVKVRRRLARGRMAIDARLDLHGARQIEAHARLTRFIDRSRHKGHRCVLVITGKGSSEGSFGAERGVLRRLVPEWLRQMPLAPQIIGLEPAAPQHGGDGALYVLLRTKPVRR